MQQLPRTSPATPDWHRLEQGLFEMAEVLDGYPMADLVDLYVQEDRPARVLALLDTLIEAWVARLSHDIDRLQGPAPETLCAARRRLMDTREALCRIRTMFAQLGHAWH